MAKIDRAVISLLVLGFVSVSVSAVISIPKASEECSAAPQGTNGAHEVVIPENQSLNPTDVLTTTTLPAVMSTGEHATLVVVDSGEDVDTSISDQATVVAGNSISNTTSTPTDLTGPRLLTVGISGAGASSSRSCLPIRSTNSTAAGSSSPEIPKEGENEDNEFFNLGFTRLAFEAAADLVVSLFQAPGYWSSSVPNSSPSSSFSCSCPWYASRSPPSSCSSLWSSSSFPFAMVWVAIGFRLAVTLIGMVLRRARSTGANICSYAGVFSIALAFFSMISAFVPDHFAWTVWVAAGILLLTCACSIVERSCKITNSQ